MVKERGQKRWPPAIRGARVPCQEGCGSKAGTAREAPHLTMRKGQGKTVMAAKDSEASQRSERGKAHAPSAERKALDQLLSATLSPTALVNEAWLKLAKSPDVGATSRLHFKRIAARAMRQLLVEAARRRNSDKRGGGAEITVIFDDTPQKKPSGGEELLALNPALDSLAPMNPRQAEMVESRFFGGLDVPETAALLEVSEATVLRDWRAAKAWLANELRQNS